VLSSEPGNTKAPSGEKAANQTMLVWPCKVFKHSPDSQLQIFAVRLAEPVNTKAPSGEKTAEKILLVWPCKVFKHSPDSQLQIFAVLSTEPVNTKAPSGEKTAELIPLVWPCKVFKHSPESQLQIFAVLSSEPVNTRGTRCRTKVISASTTIPTSLRVIFPETSCKPNSKRNFTPNGGCSPKSANTSAEVQWGSATRDATCSPPMVLTERFNITALRRQQEAKATAAMRGCRSHSRT
jgi:hypothetical protein